MNNQHNLIKPYMVYSQQENHQPIYIDTIYNTFAPHIGDEILLKNIRWLVKNIVLTSRETFNNQPVGVEVDTVIIVEPIPPETPKAMHIRYNQ